MIILDNYDNTIRRVKSKYRDMIFESNDLYEELIKERLFDKLPSGEIYGTKYESIIEKNEVISNTIWYSLNPRFTKPHYELMKGLLPYFNNNKINVAILGSWYGIFLLEMLSLRAPQINKVTLIDHDPTVIKVSERIKPLLTLKDVRYVKRNVIFDDNSDILDECTVFIVPSINMLLPFEDLVPNPKPGSLIGICGDSNTMQKRYGNAIFNVDDLKSQTNFSKELHTYQETITMTESWPPIKTSVLVAQV